MDKQPNIVFMFSDQQLLGYVRSAMDNRWMLLLIWIKWSLKVFVLNMLLLVSPCAVQLEPAFKQASLLLNLAVIAIILHYPYMLEP